MRIPVRSEGEAFRLVVGGLIAVAAAVLIGWLTAAAIGAAVFALILVAALVAYLRAGNPDRRPTLRGAAHEPHPHGPRAGRRHVLVIANEPLSGSALCERIVGDDHEQTEIDKQTEIDILAPVLSSHVHYGVSDIDRERERAQDRLNRSLRWAREHGISARGEVGDPSVLTAIEDELRDFGAAEVIVVTGPEEQQTWQEREELEHLLDELDITVTHVVSDGHGSPGPS
jgi:hypothetical protein